MSRKGEEQGTGPLRRERQPRAGRGQDEGLQAGTTPQGAQKEDPETTGRVSGLG